VTTNAERTCEVLKLDANTKYPDLIRPYMPLLRNQTHTVFGMLSLLLQLDQQLTEQVCYGFAFETTKKW
jgi:hypothetical protein